jgi:hypothetical protein
MGSGRNVASSGNTQGVPIFSKFQESDQRPRKLGDRNTQRDVSSSSADFHFILSTFC